MMVDTLNVFSGMVHGSSMAVPDFITVKNVGLVKLSIATIINIDINLPT